MSEKLRFGLRVASYVVRGACAVHVVQAGFYEFTETRGESMLPTLAAYGDFVHCLKKYRLGRGIEIGDCVVALKPTDPDQRVCKRVTGMPGDLILVDPSNISDASGEDDGESFNQFIRVPEGHCWVTGDNLAHSLDSRTYNCMPLGLIKGKIVAANDFNEPFMGGAKGDFWGFRLLENNYVGESRA